MFFAPLTVPDPLDDPIADAHINHFQSFPSSLSCHDRHAVIVRDIQLLANVVTSRRILRLLEHGARGLTCGASTRIAMKKATDADNRIEVSSIRRS